MNLYETLRIVTPEADDDAVNAVIGDLRTSIESDGGTVLQAGVWQRRQLAYAVQGKTEGIYELNYAEGPVTFQAVVKDRMRLDEAVIRNMVVRLEGVQETDVRASIAEQEVSAGEAEAQRLAAERRAAAAAEAAAMSAAEAEAAAEEASEAEAEAEAAAEAEAEDDGGEAADEGAEAAEDPASDDAEAAEAAADEPAETLNDDAGGDAGDDAGDQDDEDTTDEEERES